MIKYILIGIFLILLIESFYETRVFKIKEYRFKSPKFNKNDREQRIIVLADLHNHSYGKHNEKLIKAIKNSRPDIIIVAGDLLTAKPGEDFKTAVSLMKELSKEYPIYYGNGNHEYRLKCYPERYGGMYQEYTSYLRAYGVHFLENEKTTILLGNTPVDIYGLEIDKEYYRRFKEPAMEENYLEDTLGKKGRNYTLLIAHNPDYFPWYAKWGADITFSGHIHGGVINLPVGGGVASPQVRFFPKYDGGLFEQDKRFMVLSRGLGTHTINIRINNKAELILVKLKGE